MKAIRKRQWLLIVGFVLAVVGMNLPAVYTHFYHQLTSAPEAVSGVIDLSTTRLADGRTFLDGEWEFYWNRLLISEPGSATEPDLYASVPGEWSDYSLDGAHLPAAGVGSYRLTVSGLHHDAPVTVSIPDFGGAYRVFIDGQLAARSGRVTADVAQVFTTPQVQLYPIRLSTAAMHEVVIEVATARFSGLYMTPLLNDYERAEDADATRNSARLILFGVAVSSFLILLLIYIVFVRRKLGSFWLPIITVLVILRMMLTAESYSFWQPILFGNLSYELTNELLYLVTFAMKYMMIFLVQEQCGLPFSRRTKADFLVYYELLYLLYLLTPADVYNQYLSVIVPMLTYALDVYLFVRIYREQQPIKRFGLVIYWSTVLVIAGLTMESYYINGKSYLDTSLMLPAFLTVFLLVISCVYAIRVGDLYDDFVESSSRLELAQHQMQMQKEYYAAINGQMAEIREIKHDIRHFIGAMTGLVDEGKFSELQRFLSEYSQRVETERLPLFCQHAIANSLIGYYYLQARANGIPFSCQCNLGYQVRLSDSDLCIIFGNALENAINACKQVTEHERRFVSIEVAIRKRQWLLKVQNSYSPLPEGAARPGSAQSGRVHGIGLPNIRKVVAAYGGFVRIEKNDQVFTLMAAVPEM